MTQPNISAMAPKTTSTTPDSPDLMALLKRYMWLLIAGAVVGAGASGGYYMYADRYEKEYTARVPFVVLPPQPAIGQEQNQTIQLNLDDTSQIINRQVFTFQQENFLQDVLISTEFHTRPDARPDDPPGDCDWLVDNKKPKLWGLWPMDPLKALKRDLVVVPRVNAGSFEVTMKARNRMEAFNLVKAAVKVYKQRLLDESTKKHTAYKRNLEDQVKIASDAFEIKNQAMLDYIKRKGIDVLKSRFDIEKTALQGLNDEFTKANAAASNAKSQYAAILNAEPKPSAIVSELKLPAGWKYETKNDNVAPFGMAAAEKGMELRLVPENSADLKGKMPLTIWIMESEYQPAPSTAPATQASLASAVQEWPTWNGHHVFVYTDGNKGWPATDTTPDALSELKRALKEAGKETFELSSELKQSVDNDNRVMMLANTRLSWEQEKAAKLTERSSAAGGIPVTSASPATSAAIAAIDARIKMIDNQIVETKNKLTDEARIRMKKMLADESTSKQFLADFIGKIRLDKETIVTGIGQDLLVWQQRVDDLKEQGDLVTKLRSQLAMAVANQGTDDTRVAQLDDPTEPNPNNPSYPKWYMFIPLGTIAGLGLSALLAYLLMLTDTRVRTPRDISKTLQMPVLGFIPDESDDRMLNSDVETAILTSPVSMVAEAFRQIRGHINAQTVHNPIHTLTVASIGPGGGASTVAANLAAAMALNDLRVLLIDANFYRPSLGRIFKGMPKEGFTNVVADPTTAESCIMPHPNLAKLHLMGVGTLLAGASSELFEGKAFRELLDHLKSKYDMVVFDGAPMSLVADSLALAARTDGVVSVVRAGAVSRGAVSRVREQIRSVRGNLLGFVLNAAQTSNTGYYKENYRSFYKYAGKSPRSLVK